MINLRKWNKALNIAYMNAGVFFLLSVLMFAFEPEYLLMILMVPTIYFFGSMYTFFLMVRSGSVMIPVAWFILGTGIFLGLGVVSGGLHAHPWADKLFGNDVTYLINVNTLNSSSVLIIFSVVYIVLRYTSNNDYTINKQAKKLQQSSLIKFFPYIALIAFIGVTLKLIFFPIAEDLLLRSFIDKAYFFVPACIFLFGIFWRDVNLVTKLTVSLVFLVSIMNGLLGFSKLDVITILSAFLVGVLVRNYSLKSIIISFSAIIFVYVMINPIVTYGRAHIDYNAQHNSLSDRVKIITNLIFSYSTGNDLIIHPTHNGNKQVVQLKEAITLKEQSRQIGMRLDVASIQGYLINEYNAGRRGESIDKFWTILIPRILWKDKPIMTNNAGKLNAQYYGGGKGTESSAIAPTYVAEAYWNYGLMGVLIVSLYLGLIIGWFSNLASKLLSEPKSGYFLIAFPSIIMFAHIESWVVPTYIGGLGTLIVILLAFQMLLFINNLIRFGNLNKG